MKNDVDRKQCADLYANTQARINTMVGESSETWALIKKSHKVWMSEAWDSHTSYTFPVWLENKHGIRLVEIDGGLSTAFDVVDEAKYVLFLLKYA